MNEKHRDVKNRWFYGLGTVGRDFYYTMVSMYLMFYLTDVLELAASTMWFVTGAMIITRVFDAFNDASWASSSTTREPVRPVKPWITAGAIFSFIFTSSSSSITASAAFLFALIFLLVYLFLGDRHTANDICLLVDDSLALRRSEKSVKKPDRSPASVPISACSRWWSALSLSPTRLAKRREA